MAQISIIVPVYRVQNYIKRCIESILRQSYSDFELILIDDGSSDECPQICDEYASKDSRVKVIHKKNGGLSSARNYGLEIAEGKWITFIDSDDWIHLKYLECLQFIMIESNSSISMAKFKKVHEYCDDDMPSFNYQVVSGIEALFYKNHPRAIAYAWGRLYERRLFYKVRFVEGMYMEDFYTIPEVMSQNVQCAIADDALYYYYIENPNSITHTKNIEKLNQDSWNGYDHQLQIYKEKSLDLYLRSTLKEYLLDVCGYYLSIPTEEKMKKKHTKNIAIRIINDYREYLDFTDQDIIWNICQISDCYKLFFKICSIMRKYSDLLNSVARSKSK